VAYILSVPKYLSVDIFVLNLIIKFIIIVYFNYHMIYYMM
jgi:hypothetical protein